MPILTSAADFPIEIELFSKLQHGRRSLGGPINLDDRLHCRAPWGLAIIVLGTLSRAIGGDGPGEIPRHPGVIAEYRQGASRLARVDAAVGWPLREPADTRLSDKGDRKADPGPITVHWQGELAVDADGTYQIHAWICGRMVVRHEGQTIWDVENDKPQRIRGPAIEWEAGPKKIRIEFTADLDHGQLILYWSGPGFELEPLGPQRWSHLPTDVTAEWLTFERGRELTKNFRCAACHSQCAPVATRPATALDAIAENIRPAWLVEWFVDRSAVTSANNPTYCPDYRVERADAQAIVAWLCHRSGTDTADPGEEDEHPGSVGEGEQQFLTLGCLACHPWPDRSQDRLATGPDLSRIAAKRPSPFFARWLSDPATVNRDHRMPRFSLTAAQIQDLTSFLNGLGTVSEKTAPTGQADPLTHARGRQLTIQWQCQACHRLDVGDPVLGTNPTLLPAPLRWPSSIHGERSCLAPSGQAVHQPRLAMTDADREAIQVYLSRLDHPLALMASSFERGRDVLIERGCLECHARDGENRFSQRWSQRLDRYPQLAAERHTLSPPSLDGIGDKWTDDGLRSTIIGSATDRPRLRPWLRIQMPRYSLPDQELQDLVHYLSVSDRIQGDNVHMYSIPIEAGAGAMREAGSRLVTSEGFGCTSCHAIGEVEPPAGPVATRGPNLAGLAQRVRPSWFARWLRNPQRIVPRVEMPAISVPVPRILSGDLSAQTAALWHVLADPSFRPARSGPLRTLRAGPGADGHTDRAVVLTDNLRFQEKIYVKPLVVGLPNQHNVLFDLTRFRLAGWWIGDTAHQLLDGKYWYWEAAGRTLGVAETEAPDLSVTDGMAVYQTIPDEGQSWGVDDLQFIPAGIRIQRRVPLYRSDRRESVIEGSMVIRVSESITVFRDAINSNRGGFNRHVQMSGFPPSAKISWAISLRQATPPEGAVMGEMRVRLDKAGDGLMLDAQSGHVVGMADEKGGVTATLIYDTDVHNGLLDKKVVADRHDLITEALPLAVAGWQATRVRLPGHILPTALAWRPSGELMFASLDGRVWHARDQDQDGMEDQIVDVGVELVAPFGLHCAELPPHHRENPDRQSFGLVDVIDKTALLRLHDTDRDDRIDRIQTLADGWGHSTDYHGWVVGLPMDEGGNFFAAISQREKASSPPVRGAVVRIVPQLPTEANPRTYSFEVIASGLRFPVGMARNRLGDLFVTDNQGEYTPFNELNHILPGAFYGFVSQYNRAEELGRPVQGPCIAIGHPWTRSVNGIAFLETPDRLRAEGNILFGPWEGDLLGCDYDTGHLVRMSLQKIHGTYQGAVYPLTRTVADGRGPFLGPVTCAVAPDGDVYVGSLRDSAWGAGQNTGEIVRLRCRPAEIPPGIDEVHAEPNGLRIRFTTPVDEEANDPARYHVESYTRSASAEYGGDDQHRRRESIQTVELSSDRQHVFLQLGEWRAGFVYEIRTHVNSADGRPLHPAEAYYTVVHMP